MKSHEHSINRIIGLSTELDSIYNEITKLKTEVKLLTKTTQTSIQLLKRIGHPQTA